jgi:hypothetical protein
MKVFISWSGDLSKRLGEAIRDWIPGVLQTVTPYFTPSDIEKGARWSMDIAKELEESQIGILCVTQDNLHSDWILFEAGALSKRMQKSHVCPILFGITNTDLAGPLKQFQTTDFEKGEFHKLLGVMNAQLGEYKLPPKTLELVFDKWWPDLEAKINEILSDVEQSDVPIRSDRDLLEEILQLNRAAIRRSGRPPISVRAITDLLEKFIALHDEQMNQIGDYQSALDSLKNLSKSVGYIASRYTEQNEELRELFAAFNGLSFQVNGSEHADDSDNEDVPF